jgi:hypothetical protein
MSNGPCARILLLTLAGLKALPCTGPMRNRLRPVAAHRHAAPPPRVTLADVVKPQGARWAFATANEGEVLMAEEIANRLRYRQQ